MVAVPLGGRMWRLLSKDWVSCLGIWVVVAVFINRSWTVLTVGGVVVRGESVGYWHRLPRGSGYEICSETRK